MPQSRMGPSFGRPEAAQGWRIEEVVRPSRLIGANGVRLGPDGRLYVAQAIGSQISALDVRDGAIETIVPVDGAIMHPDDLAFDSRGDLYATEIMAGRVSRMRPGGACEPLWGDFVAPNGITIHEDRIFIDEFRPGGRMFELYADGRPPRLIGSDLPAPNALSLGPDGYIYFPAVLQDEIWRIPVEGGAAERVLGGVSAPVAVKFDAAGRLYTAASATGDIWRADTRTGDKTRVAATRPGIDNFALGPDGSLFVSHYTDGGVSEVAADGRQREIAPPAMLGPWAVAAAPGGGVFVADGLSLARVGPDGALDRISNFLSDAGFPGFLRGVAVADEDALWATNSAGDVALYAPHRELQVLASGLGQIMGLAAQGSERAAACEADGGRLLAVGAGDVSVLARGLGRPVGLAARGEGDFIVADADGGRLLHVRHGEAAVLVEGFREPHGVALRGDDVLVLDRGARILWAVARDGRRFAIARGLPVGAAPGITPHGLPGIAGLIAGPILPFAGLAVDAAGAVYIAGDGDGSLLRLTAESA